MIGLMFLFVLALWALIALVLGRKMPQWLGITHHRTALGFVFALLVFVAPVADEIIAWPQMRALCQQNRFFEFVPGMDDKSVHDRTVYSEERRMFSKLWPSSVEVLQWKTVYVDAITKEALFQRSGTHPLSGMLGVPNGSSGGRMTILLSACESTGESFDSKDIPSRFSHLNLTKIPKP